MNSSKQFLFRSLAMMALFFLAPWDGSACSACCAGERFSLSELLNDPNDGRYIFHCRVDSAFYLPRQGYMGYATLVEAFRGEFTSQQLVLTAGGNSSAGGQMLQAGAEYVVFGHSKDGRNFQAFVCDVFSAAVYSPTYAIDINETALPIVRRYFELKKSGHNGPVEFKLKDKIVAKGEFKNGQPHGGWKHYYLFGNKAEQPLKSELSYWEGQYHDTCRYYESNSLKQLKALHVFDKGNSIYSEHYRLNGKSSHKTYEINYRQGSYGAVHKTTKYFGTDGKINGISSMVELNMPYLIDGVYFKTYLEGSQKNYHKNGVLKEEGNCHLGAKVGTWRSYDEVGRLAKEEPFNMPDTTLAPFMIFYKNGGVRVLGQWAEGRPDGRWICYFENSGNTQSTLNFKKGKLHGRVKIYDYNTYKLSQEVNYVDGHKHGHEKYYRPDGVTLYLTNQYVSGVLDGEHKEFFPDGQLSAVFTLKKGLNEGGFIRYYVPGIIQEKGPYLNGSKHGLFEEVEGDKQVAKGEYYYGRKVGRWQTFYPSGKLSAECRYPEKETIDLTRQPNFYSSDCVYYHEDGTVKTGGK